MAYAGRWPGIAPDEEGKDKLPTGFHKSVVVYNLHSRARYIGTRLAPIQASRRWVYHGR